MELYPVIIINFELPSFQWGNGMYAIFKKEDDILHLWKIKDGKLNRYQDGTPDIMCTGTGNKGILQTDMIITYNK